jgi:hypothetical protein
MRKCIEHISKGNNKHGYIDKKMFQKFNFDIGQSTKSKSMKAAYLAMFTIIGLDIFSLI